MLFQSVATVKQRLLAITNIASLYNNKKQLWMHSKALQHLRCTIIVQTQPIGAENTPAVAQRTLSNMIIIHGNIT